MKLYLISKSNKCQKSHQPPKVKCQKVRMFSRKMSTTKNVFCGIEKYEITLLTIGRMKMAEFITVSHVVCVMINAFCV